MKSRNFPLKGTDSELNFRLAILSWSAMQVAGPS
jgi:hypothetical protein